MTLVTQSVNLQFSVAFPCTVRYTEDDSIFDQQFACFQLKSLCIAA